MNPSVPIVIAAVLILIGIVATLAMSRALEEHDARMRAQGSLRTAMDRAQATGDQPARGGASR